MNQIEVAFQKLGNTKEEVYNFLKANYYKGYRCQGSRCPIANYLKSCGFTDVCVSSDSMNIGIQNNIPIPKPISDFIISFDRREFPDLIMEFPGSIMPTVNIGATND